MKDSKLILSILLNVFTFSASAENVIYFYVKEKQSLSRILYRDLNLCPLYGRNGWVAKIKGHNRNLFKRKDDLIMAGDIIYLPPEVFTNKGSCVNNKGPKKISRAISAVPQLVVNNQAEEEQSVFFRIEPHLSWLKLTSVDSNRYLMSSALVISKPVLGLELNYGFKLNNKFTLYFVGKYSKIEFYPDPRYVISKNKFSKMDYGLESEYRLDQDLKFYTGFSYSDEFYLTIPSFNKLVPVVVQAPEVHVGIKKSLWKFQKARFEAGFEAKIILPSESPEINGKLGGGLSADLTTTMGNKAIRFYFNYSQAKARNNSTNISEVGWSFTLQGKTE